MDTTPLTPPAGAVTVISQRDYDALCDTLEAQQDALEALTAPRPPVVVVDVNYQELGRQALEARRRLPGYLIVFLCGSVGGLLLARLAELAVAGLVCGLVIALALVLRGGR